MEISIETKLTNFEFWSGAKNHNFTYSELNQLEEIIEDIFYEETPTDTQINDLFWFEEGILCEWIGIDFEEDYLNR